MATARSILFLAGLVAAAIIHGLVTTLVAIFLNSEQRYRVAATLPLFIKWWLHITCGISYRVIGEENIIAAPAVIVSNHQSAWETFMIQRLFNPLCPVLKKELTNIPFFGWAVRLVDPIAIDRHRKQNALKQLLSEGCVRLNQKKYVMIFPEGTRVAPGEVVPHFSGGSLLAVKAGVPIIPIVHNSGYFWPAHHIKKTPGVITLKIGAPIDTQSKSPKALTAEIEAWMRREFEQLPKS
ncbi:Phospholipid/glycerol acyltransferase [gamma proteobacterium HdN1]|nr:Phospholipid/glycerol acyltransferase [gamma proteobacterium HdN1]